MSPEPKAERPITRRTPAPHYPGEPVRLRVITAAEAAALPKPPADPLDVLIAELAAAGVLTPAAVARVRAARTEINRTTGGPRGGH